MKNFLYCLVAWLAVYHDNTWLGGKVGLLFHRLFGHREYLPIAHLLGLELREVGEGDKAKPGDFDFSLVGRTETMDREVWDGKLLHKVPDVSMGGVVTREIYEMPLPHMSQVPDPGKGRTTQAYKRTVP